RGRAARDDGGPRARDVSRRHAVREPVRIRVRHRGRPDPRHPRVHGHGLCGSDRRRGDGFDRHVSVFEVVAVRYATRETTKSECYYRYWTYGEPDAPIRMDYYFWILRGGGETVLVDTGFAPESGTRRGRTCLCEPLEALRRLGIDPGSVSLVVLTHLHYDHTGNLEAFPDAELVVQRRELEFWPGPMASRFQFAGIVEHAEIDQVLEAERAGRARVIEGKAEIAPGILALDVGGHSPGQQVTVVES